MFNSKFFRVSAVLASFLFLNSPIHAQKDACSSINDDWVGRLILGQGTHTCAYDATTYIAAYVLGNGYLINLKVHLGKSHGEYCNDDTTRDFMIDGHCEDGKIELDYQDLKGTVDQNHISISNDEHTIKLWFERK